MRIPFVDRVLLSDLACSPFGLSPRQMMLACAKRLRQCYILESSFIDQVPEPRSPLSEAAIDSLIQTQPAATLYPACIELEILPHEIDFANAEHQRTLAKWEVHRQDLARRVEQLVTRINPSRIVYFQGHLPEAAVLRETAIHRDIPRLAIERSAFGNRLTWDNRSGVAVNSDLPREKCRTLSQRPSDSAISAFARTYIEGINAQKQSEHASPLATLDLPELPNGGLRMLFLGQVMTDSSIVFGSKPGLDPLSVLDILSRHAASGNHHLVVKLHPKENGGISPLGNPYRNLTYRRIGSRNSWSGPHPLRCRSVCIDATNRWNTFRLIEQSDLVVTINSQAGFEAALMGKPVILCGRSFYSSMGFTTDVETPEDLQVALDRSEPHSQTDEAKLLQAARFFHFFCQRYTVPNRPESLFRLMASN